MEFFTCLPPPPKCVKNSYYRTHEEQDEYDKRIAEKAVSLADTVSVDFENCTHPESMFDESTNSCIACGTCNGVRAAALSENGINFSGIHFHTFSSAAASAAARKRRGNATAALAGTTVCFGAKTPMKADESPLLVVACARDGGEMAPIQMINDEIQRYVVQSSALKVSGGWGCTSVSQNAPIKRAALFAELATSIFSAKENPVHAIITSGAFLYKGGEPCPVAAKLVTSGSITAEALAKNVLCNVYKIVAQNMVYFNTPQRRRLHHLALFVAVVASHIEVVHAANNEMSSAGVCIELDRVLAKAKPSQSRFARRSMIMAVADRLGVSSTCATRLVQDAYDIVSAVQ